MSSVRLIKPSRVRDFWRLHPKARSPLQKWLAVTEQAEWKQFSDIRRIYRHADQVKVGSERMVVVFDIGGNDFRLICAVHYNLGKVFVLRFLTHAEYSENDWKKNL